MITLQLVQLFQQRGLFINRPIFMPQAIERISFMAKVADGDDKETPTGLRLEPGCLGVTIYYGNNPMPVPCKECPFIAAETGRDYLRPGRLDGIKLAVSVGQLFACHKTVHHQSVPAIDDDGNKPVWHRHYRACAGATQYAERLAEELRITPTRIGTKPNPSTK